MLYCWCIILLYSILYYIITRELWRSRIWVLFHHTVCHHSPSHRSDARESCVAFKSEASRDQSHRIRVRGSQPATWLTRDGAGCIVWERGSRKSKADSAALWPRPAWWNLNVAQTDSSYTSKHDYTPKRRWWINGGRDGNDVGTDREWTNTRLWSKSDEIRHGWKTIIVHMAHFQLGSFLLRLVSHWARF